jgi:hypothetical protein
MTLLTRVLASVLIVTAPLAAAEFVSKEKGFRVTFPAAARELGSPPQLGPNIAGFKQWLVEIAPRAYTVSVTDWQTLGPDDDTLLDLLKDAAVSSLPGGQLKGERFIAVDGRAGRELDIDLPDGSRFTTALLLDRAARRSIQVLAGVPKTELAHPSVRAFLDSFRFLTPIEKTIYTAKGGTFSAVFPGPVIEKSEEVPEGVRLTAETAADGRSFNVTQVESKTKLDGDAQQRLDNSRDGMLKRVKEARLVSETRTTVGSRPARDLQMDAAGNQTMFARIVLDAPRQRAFVMMVISRKPRADAAVAKAFFDTFRLAEAR